MDKLLKESLMTLKEKLVYFRKTYHYTQKEVAQKLNITHQSYQAYESGVALPTLQNFIKLCAVFEVTPNELLGII